MHSFRILLLFSFITLVAYGARIEAENAKPDLAAVADQLISKTNTFRAKESQPKLAANAKLQDAARYFADYMAKTNKFSHTADDKQPFERAKEHGYDQCLILENIAYQQSARGFATAELADKFFEAWKQSPGHRKNLLDPDATEIGIAVAHRPENGYYYAVQMFGRPKSKQIEFQVLNASGATVEYKIGDQKLPLKPRHRHTHQRCRASELTLELEPQDGQPLARIKAQHGDKLRIVRTKSGRLQIEKS